MAGHSIGGSGSTPKNLPVVVRLQGSADKSICLFRRSNTVVQRALATPQKTGRPSDAVWEYFERLGASKTGPHYVTRCNFCHVIFSRGKAGILRKHLAYDCKNAPDDCKEKFLVLLSSEDVNADGSKKRKKDGSSVVTSPTFVQSFQPLKHMESLNDSLDKELIKCLISCNIPFSIVNNPIFSAFLHKLKPDYTLPTKNKLTGKLLWEEAETVSQWSEVYMKHQTNLTLIIEGWEKCEQNIYAFIVMTSDRRVFLNSLHCFSNGQNVADFLSIEVEKTIANIGPEKISALITENSINIEKVRENILQKYPHILNLRSIPHYLYVITNDILKHVWAQDVLKKCQAITNFFTEHSRLNLLLKKCRDNSSIPELTGIIKSHLYSSCLCIKYLLKNEHALHRVCAVRAADIPNEIRNIICDQQFWMDVDQLSKLTKPFIQIIMLLELNNATLADCYRQLICLAAAVNCLQCNCLEFQNHCKAAYISRWDELNDAIYILAYFLHPTIRGKGLVQAMFAAILEVAGNLWKRSGHGKASTVKLLTQVMKFKQKSEPYNNSMTNEWLTPLLWWETVDTTNAPEIKALATKLLSISSHSVHCERIFSILNWIKTKTKYQLNVQRLETMAKIYMFYMSHGSKNDEMKAPSVVMDQFMDSEIIDIDEGIIYTDQTATDENLNMGFAMSDDFCQMWEKFNETFDLQGEIFNSVEDIVTDDNTPEVVAEVIIQENDTDFEIQDVLADLSTESATQQSYLEYFD